MNTRGSPPRAAVQWSSVRALTLGELVEGVRRHWGYAAVVIGVTVIAIFFPGRLPVSRLLAPLGGAVGGATAVGGAPPPGAFPIGVGLPEVSVAGAGGGGLAAPSRPTPEGAAVAVLGDSAGPQQPSPPTAPPGTPACAADEQLPAEVVGPGLDQAAAAQAALEGAFGARAPVDLVATFRDQLCGAGAGAATGDLLVLAGMVPRDDAGLLAALEPAIRPSCDVVELLAGLERGLAGRVSSATSAAVSLCAAARSAPTRASPPGVGGSGAGTVEVDELAPGPGLEIPRYLQEAFGWDGPVDPDVPATVPLRPDLGRP